MGKGGHFQPHWTRNPERWSCSNRDPGQIPHANSSCVWKRGEPPGAWRFRRSPLDQFLSRTLLRKASLEIVSRNSDDLQ